MKQIAFKYSCKSFFCLCLFLLSGCMGATLIGDKAKDVTGNSEFWGGFIPGQVYMLVQDLFMRKISNAEYTLVPEHFDDRFSSGIKYPKTFNEFKNNPGSFPDFSIVSKGLRIKCDKIEYWSNDVYGEIDVYGVFMNEQLPHAKIYLNQISKPANQSSAGPFCRTPNENYLQPE